MKDETAIDLSVILSTHDRPDALALALEGIRAAAAGAGRLEVVVADDGSGPETAALIGRFGATAPFPVSHSWQEPRGFRLAASRNRAVRAARGERLVFLDGDCILKPDALRIHRARCRPGRAHTGARILLGENETAALLGKSTVDSRQSTAGDQELIAGAERRERRRLRRLYLTNLLYRLTRLKPRPKLAAANCAVHRRDLVAVNGFDERFVGWGHEDDDLARRLRRNGVRIMNGTLDCRALHLFHLIHPSHRPSSRGTENYRYFQRNSFLTRCRRGLEPRPLESLRFQVLGEPPTAVRPLLGDLGSSERASPASPEVSLIFPGVPAARARGEVKVVLTPETLAGGPAAVRTQLEELL